MLHQASSHSSQKHYGEPRHPTILIPSPPCALHAAAAKDWYVRHKSVHYESDLNIIRQWMNSNGMELSSKTEFMGFGAAAARIGNSHLTCHSRDCGEACALNCIKIAAVTHFRYLGITMNSGLTWGRHINGVSTSLRSLAFQLYKMRGACSESLMRCYYFALGESRLRCGLLCWGGACAAHLKPVILAQKRVIRTICYLRK
ncbi:hypothetical protein DMENIID0001_098620 [Sergentomyia squamirostris]